MNENNPDNRISLYKSTFVRPDEENDPNPQPITLDQATCKEIAGLTYFYIQPTFNLFSQVNIFDSEGYSSGS